VLKKIGVVESYGIIRKTFFGYNIPDRVGKPCQGGSMAI